MLTLTKEYDRYLGEESWVQVIKYDYMIPFLWKKIEIFIVQENVYGGEFVIEEHFTSLEPAIRFADKAC